MREILRITKRLLGYTRPVWPLLLPGIFGVALVDLMITWFNANLLGEATAALDTGNYFAILDTLKSSAWLLVCIFVLDVVCNFLLGKAMAMGTAHMRGIIFKNQMHATLASSHSIHSGEKLSYIINDVPVAIEALDVLMVPVNALTMGLSAFIYMVLVDKTFALMVLGMIVLAFSLSLLLSTKMHSTVVRIQDAMARVSVHFKSLLDGMVTARMYKITDKIDRDLDEAATEAAEGGVRRSRISATMSVVNTTFWRYGDQVFIFIAGVFYIASKLEMNTVIKIGQMAGGAMSVALIARVVVRVQGSLAGARRIFKALDETETETEMEEETTAEKPVAIDKSGDTAIQFRDVSFGYGADSTVLQNFNLTVQKGELLAISGMSGTGKSTLLRMVQGLYHPTTGQVEVFGTDVNRWNGRTLRETASLIPQDSVLFPGTIANNIAIGTGITDQNAIEKAAIAAGAHNFITAMPDGYGTQVAERGSSLSGGQVQRIAIARALLKQAPILLLDEATAALDGTSEETIKETLLGLKGQYTIVIVTHRAKTMEMADRIFEMPAFAARQD